MAIAPEFKPRLLFGTLHYSDRCGAKTRSGAPCKNMPRQIGGRCRMHGGNARRGPEHPRYKEGKYSKYKPADVLDGQQLLKKWAAEPMPDLSDIIAELGQVMDDLKNLIA